MCGEDRHAPADTGRAESILDFERAASDELDTLSPLEEDEGVLPRPKAPGPHTAYLSEPASAAIGRSDGDGHPAFWQGDANEGGRRHWLGGMGATGRLVLCVVAVLLVLAGALAIDYVRSGRLDQAARLRVFTADMAQAQGALARGDLDVAERALSTLEREHADDPGVQRLRGELDLRTQAQAARREQLQEAARKAVQALGLSTPAAPGQAPTAPPAGPATGLTSVSAPGTAAPADATSKPAERPCSEALAALSLCVQTPAAPTRPDTPRAP